MKSLYDCVVIGGGPAGITAAIYLARLNRSVLVIDKKRGRWNHNQVNDNYLGFPKGIAARLLRSKGKQQAKKFGAKFILDEAKTIKNLEGKFSIKGDKQTYSGRSLILATGVGDFYPFTVKDIYIGNSVFWCIICDAYKVRKKEVVVVGHDDKAVSCCMRLLNFTKKISLLTNCAAGADTISHHARRILEKNNIPIVSGVITKIRGKRGLLEGLLLDTGTFIAANYMFSKQGTLPNTQLATQLGVIIEGEGYIKIDVEQRTNIDHVYAAGDVTNEFNHQIITAAHEGSTAAVSVNEDLLSPDQKIL